MTEIAAVAGVLSAEDIWHSPNPRTANPGTYGNGMKVMVVGVFFLFD